MSKWIDFSIDERRAMIQAVSQAKQIDEASAEKDTIEHDLLLAPVWMRQIIKRNIKGQDNE